MPRLKSRVQIPFPAPISWRHSQVVRQRSAKPLFPGSNPGAASRKKGWFYEPSFFCARDLPLRGVFVSYSGKTGTDGFSKSGELFFLDSFEEKAGNIFFPPDVAVVEEGCCPDARGPYQETNDQGRSQRIHLFPYLLALLLHVPCR